MLITNLKKEFWAEKTKVFHEKNVLDILQKTGADSANFVTVKVSGITGRSGNTSFKILPGICDTGDKIKRFNGIYLI